MGHIIDMAAWRTARGADARPPVIGSPAPSNDALDGMLQAVSAVLKARALGDDVRWRLIGTIMQSSGQACRR